MSKLTKAFVLDHLFIDEQDWTIRIVIPGIDGGCAVWLETTCKRDNKAQVEALLTDVLEGLKDITRE